MPKASRFPKNGQFDFLARQLHELPGTIGRALLDKVTYRLYTELEARGITYRPDIYLSDEWGCPDRTPAIGIPFYLADGNLCRLVGEASGCPVEDEEEAMLYLRHEAGHAFNYAYELYKEPAWQQLFGIFTVPYPYRYRTRPFSPHYVRHIPGWYAQKHPDEDFAESFAVWLTPASNWQERYLNTPAHAKLRYVEDATRRLAGRPPSVNPETRGRPVEELTGTLAEWCKARGRASAAGVRLPATIGWDLRDLFPSETGSPVADLLEETRPQLLKEVHAWTGLDRGLLYALLVKLEQLARSLRLKTGAAKPQEAIVSLTVFVTTLAMNYQKTRAFVED